MAIHSNLANSRAAAATARGSSCDGATGAAGVAAVVAEAAGVGNKAGLNAGAVLVE